MSWKFAVSTLGMPGAPVREAVEVAVEHGCDGLELRSHPDEEVHPSLPVRRAASLRSRIEDAGLVVSCLAGYARVCEPGTDAPVIAQLRTLIESAALLGAPSVRVFPGGEPGADGPAADRIATVLPDLAASGVRLLIETHDSHPTGEAAVRLAAPFADPGRVGVLWDALHPWRSGEPPARTRAVLGEHLGYFQVKDARCAEDPTPVPPGAGRVPLDECGAALRGWSGWISLEWEKAWYPAIQPVQEPLRAAGDWFRRWRPE
ncbi:sugar phosphate isomerase/epimerase [Saccharopolyspora gloriosae]|uniref:sugar phosphate isomerase/epimerase family protein n=1 Tax=Saccharopolyspora gloriosae TaxID=455344 RepID=UPI001FB5B1FB|nr:sugar phosphate isomerase/epimerase family protein [Saccharopolyspora gloriosae]